MEDTRAVIEVLNVSRAFGAVQALDFVEGLWRSVKYEEVYLNAYETVSAVKAGLGRYFQFYNTRRSHSSLERQTPDQVYFNRLPAPRAA